MVILPIIKDRTTENPRFLHLNDLFDFGWDPEVGRNPVPLHEHICRVEDRVLVGHVGVLDRKKEEGRVALVSFESRLPVSGADLRTQSRSRTLSAESDPPPISVDL